MVVLMIDKENTEGKNDQLYSWFQFGIFFLGLFWGVNEVKYKDLVLGLHTVNIPHIHTTYNEGIYSE